MVLEKERVEWFKRECKNNEYYTQHVLECNLKIEELDVRLTGLGSPNGNTGPKCENSVRPSPLELILQQDYWKKEREQTIKKLNYVSQMIASIKDPVDRQMIVDMFIEKKYYETLAVKYNFSCKQSLLKHANKVISRIL